MNTKTRKTTDKTAVFNYYGNNNTNDNKIPVPPEHAVKFFDQPFYSGHSTMYSESASGWCFPANAFDVVGFFHTQWDAEKAATLYHMTMTEEMDLLYVDLGKTLAVSIKTRGELIEEQPLPIRKGEEEGPNIGRMLKTLMQGSYEDGLSENVISLLTEKEGKTIH